MSSAAMNMMNINPQLMFLPFLNGSFGLTPQTPDHNNGSISHQEKVVNANGSRKTERKNEETNGPLNLTKPKNDFKTELNSQHLSYQLPPTHHPFNHLNHPHQLSPENYWNFAAAIPAHLRRTHSFPPVNMMVHGTHLTNEHNAHGNHHIQSTHGPIPMEQQLMFMSGNGTLTGTGTGTATGTGTSSLNSSSFHDEKKKENSFYSNDNVNDKNGDRKSDGLMTCQSKYFCLFFVQLSFCHFIIALMSFYCRFDVILLSL